MDQPAGHLTFDLFHISGALLRFDLAALDTVKIVNITPFGRYTITTRGFAGLSKK